MNLVKHFVPTLRSTQQRLSPTWLLSSLLLVLVLLAGCMPIQSAETNLAAGKAITLRFAVPEAQGRTLTPLVLEFVDQVNTLSKGSITIEPVWDPMAGTPSGGENKLIQMVLDGHFDFGLAASRSWDDQNIPSLHVLQTPFLISNDALAEAVATSEVATRLLNDLSSAGAVGLAMWPEDLRHPFSVVPDKPLLSPQDFVGAVIRASATGVTHQLIVALGATTTLEDDGYQGAESGLLHAFTLMGKPVPTANVTFYAKFQTFFASAKAFDKLSDAQRSLIRQAADAMLAKAIAEHPKEVDAATAYCADGGTIVLTTAEQVAAFEKAAQPVLDQIAQAPGNAELIAMLRDLKVKTPPSPGAAACVPAATAPSATASTNTQATKPLQKIEATTFEGLSSGLDNAKLARIRVSSAVKGAPNTDVYFNGLPALNAGKGLQNLEMGVFSSWLYVTPGAYTVALAPHGKPLDQALFAPVSVDAVIGHRYTVVAMGQLQANNIKPLVIDETALEAAVGAKPTDNIGLAINNLTGADGVDYLIDGKVAATMQYGEAQISICRNPNSRHEAYAVAGKPETVFASADGWCDPAAGSALSWYGNYPDSVDGTPDSGRTSELNTLDFLAAVNTQPGVMDGHMLSFKTLLAAIDKAGMRDQFANSAPYLFLAPTDEAFAALPKEQLDALLNDPQALTTLLKAHWVEGYYPYGYFSGVVYAYADGAIAVTNLLGQKLEILNSTVNGREMTGKSYMVDHGNRVLLTYKLLAVK